MSALTQPMSTTVEGRTASVAPDRQALGALVACLGPLPFPASSLNRRRRHPMSTHPIADYALLSDCHTEALVNTRIGGLAVLSAIRRSRYVRAASRRVGRPLVTIRPANAFTSSRRYRDRTLVLETTFHTSEGTVVLVDALATGPDERGHRLGAHSPRAFLRQVTCTEGSVDLSFEFAPRPEFGLVHPLLRAVEGGCAPRAAPTSCSCRRPLPQIRRLDRPCAHPSGRGRHPVVRAAASPAFRNKRPVLVRRRDQRAPGGHVEGVAKVVVQAPELRRAEARSGDAKRAGVAGAHLLPDRRHRRRGDDVPAGKHRRHAQLGLSSRTVSQYGTSPFASSRSASLMARSIATQHITLEWTKARGFPRISQMPWSF